MSTGENIDPDAITEDPAHRQHGSAQQLKADAKDQVEEAQRQADEKIDALTDRSADNE